MKKYAREFLLGVFKGLGVFFAGAVLVPLGSCLWHYIFATQESLSDSLYSAVLPITVTSFVLGCIALLLAYRRSQLRKKKRRIAAAIQPPAVSPLRICSALTAENKHTIPQGVRQQVPRGEPAQPQSLRLPAIQERILLTLARVECMPAEGIATRLQVSLHVAEYHLDKLHDANMIWADFVTYGAPVYWELMRPGRDYLVERGLER